MSRDSQQLSLTLRGSHLPHSVAHEGQRGGRPGPGWRAAQVWRGGDPAREQQAGRGQNSWPGQRRPVLVPHALRSAAQHARSAAAGALLVRTPR